MMMLMMMVMMIRILKMILKVSLNMMKLIFDWNDYWRVD